MEETSTKEEVKEKVSMLIHGVPADVDGVLQQRAAAHFRSKTGEVLAILTAVCRGTAVEDAGSLGGVPC